MNGPDKNLPPPDKNPSSLPNKWDQPPYELHACQGLNACRSHGRNQSGQMAGDGDCATANDHTCGGSNDCRGQGGCGYGTDPNENQCKGKGGCGSPIPPDQKFTDNLGRLSGESVWSVARDLFEVRMNRMGIKVAPRPTAPSTQRQGLKPTT